MYFTPRAEYPVRYHRGNYNTADKNGDSSLFFSKVLVGDCTLGNREYKEPPPKDPNNPTIRYDSCVDSMDNTKEHVIFKDTQCYPAYLMKYKLN